jgi:nickel-dependent lactate racemase
MVSVDLKFGKEVLQARFSEDKLRGVLEGDFPPSPTEEEEQAELRRALGEPIGSPSLGEIARPGQKTVIMASDITRPVPSHKILPLLVDELNACGIADGDITVLFGMGIHRGHTPREHKALVGEALYARVTCKDSTGDGYVHIGTSSAGTPYHVNTLAVEADLLICTGNVEYHWFAGYSGGAKAILPGACNYDTIKANHAMIARAGTAPGVLSGNPIRQDIDEITKFLNIGFLVNVVLNDKKEILKAFAGDVLAAHRAGCAYLDRIYSRPLAERADVVVISCGGYPKDMSLYQAQKALDNANMAVRDGGTIVMVGSCAEGFADRTFASWMDAAQNPEEILARIEREFQLGGHKASGYAKVLSRARVILVSDLPREYAARVFMRGEPKERLQAVLDEVTKDARSVVVIPQAASIFPRVEAK